MKLGGFVWGKFLVGAANTYKFDNISENIH